MRPQINYRVVSRAHARIKELAGAAAASTLVSILTTAVSPRITESWKSHLLFIVESGVLGLILPCFTSRVVRLDAGLVPLKMGPTPALRRPNEVDPFHGTRFSVTRRTLAQCGSQSSKSAFDAPDIDLRFPVAGCAALATARQKV